LLFAQGIRDIKPKLRRTRIDFAALETAEGHPLPDRLRRELEREYARLALIEAQLREVEKERDTADAQDPVVERKRQMLAAVHGVGGTSAAILAREVFARSFASRRQLGSYVSRAGKKCEPVSSIICAVHAGLWQAVTELPDIS